MRNLENPSFNSSRMQRAFRINNIEQARLQGKLNLLEKEKIHSIRVTNQDIRLISVTLDYINTCSGHSPEGLGPDSEEEYERKEDGPCFMYGERIVSRKKRRFRRPQSAVEQTSSRHSGSEASVPSSSSHLSSIRPLSSPTRRATFVTTLRDPDAETEPSFSDKESVCTASDDSWIYQTSELTKKLLRANKGRPRRESLHEKGTRRVRSHSSYDIRNPGRQLMSLDVPVPGKNEGNGRSKDRRSSSVIGKNAGLTEILNQRRPTLTSGEWMSHLAKQSKSGNVPVTVSAQRQQIMNMKLQINDSRQEEVSYKIRNFMDRTK